MTRLWLSLLTLTICVLGPVSSHPLVERAGPTLPTQDSFYYVPDDIEQYPPGAILRERKPPAPIAAFGLLKANLKDSRQIFYRTTDSFGRATATVLTVLVPHNPDYTKLLSYQIAEDAPTVDCAPSYALQLASATGGFLGTIITQAEILLIQAALEQGWIIISPDHQGSKAAFCANELAGHAILDGIRAALLSSNTTGISKDPAIALWGYSGGSITSARAAELQPSYAPELKILGMAIGGTEPNIANVINDANKGPAAGLLPSGFLGLGNEYPVVEDAINSHLKPEHRQAWAKVETQCLLANGLDFAFKDVAGMINDLPGLLAQPNISQVIAENNMGYRGVPKMPVFLYKGVFDEVSAVKDTDDIYEQYCARGASIQYVRDALAEHGIAAVTPAPKALLFLKDVLNGRKQPQGCSRKTVVSSLLDPEAAKILPATILRAMLDLIGKPIGPLAVG
ncbi:hypothetical protein H634G_05042 [Metarhizium anisopliae BRIP 53293]|uniref:Secretory lipase family protein n=1 Tax=Metarhizium anisopliae BRIP 53293 TaxID=1291518 RepID=A0A0D9P034_METAN|nr:hypothetical protein H634G_05042 [Metarhizium anisopliae BRIP 53293]KJK89455.1 hypothetical protein H633G_06704 [Metarhizium anisopliae BRIP 53284]